MAADLADLKRQIKSEVARIVLGFEKDAAVAASEVAAARRELDAQKTAIVSTSGNEARLRELEATARAKRSELDSLQRQIETNMTTLAVKQVAIEANFVSRARPSSVPSSPKRTAWSALAAASTFILGLVLQLTRELIVGGAKRPLSPPPAASAAPGQDGPNERTPFSGGASGSAAATRRRRTPRGQGDDLPLVGSLPEIEEAVLAATGDGAGHGILITGAAGELQRAEAALDMAEALSGAGRHVILVDWSLDSDGFSRLIGLPSRVGIAELLNENATFEEAIQEMPGTGVHVLSSGRAHLRIEDWQASDRLGPMLEALAAAYDVILVTAGLPEGRALLKGAGQMFDIGIHVAKPGDRTALAPGELNGVKTPGLRVLGLIGGKPKGAAAPRRAAATV